MINYGYFRHRFDAHENPKLNNLVDDIGIEAYAFYYTILELYGAKISRSDNKDSAKIHIRVIANTWRKRVDSCKRVLTKLQLSGLLVVTFDDSTCTLSIPNYLKYYGSYKKTEGSKPSKEKKRKEKKRKENKIEKDEIKKDKIEFEKNNFDQSKKADITFVQETYNQKLAHGEGLKFSKMFSGIQASKFRDISEGRFPLKSQWEEIFEKIKNSKKLMGLDKNYKYQFNPSWLFDEEKLVKIYNGEYDDLEIEEIDKAKIWDVICGKENNLSEMEQKFLNDMGGAHTLGRCTEFDAKRKIGFNSS